MGSNVFIPVGEVARLGDGAPLLPGCIVVLRCLANSLLYLALAYIGVELLVYYQEYPQAVRPYWVDPETGKLNIDRMARTDPRTGERRLLRGGGELMPRFIASVLPAGIAGLVFAALLVASVDSGLNFLSALIVMDVYRRLGWGKSTLAELRGKPLDQLDVSDDLWVARFLVPYRGHPDGSHLAFSRIHELVKSLWESGGPRCLSGEGYLLQRAIILRSVDR